jgi:hypothetical protein
MHRDVLGLVSESCWRSCVVVGQSRVRGDREWGASPPLIASGGAARGLTYPILKEHRAGGVRPGQRQPNTSPTASTPIPWPTGTAATNHATHTAHLAPVITPSRIVPSLKPDTPGRRPQLRHGRRGPYPVRQSSANAARSSSAGQAKRDSDTSHLPTVADQPRRLTDQRLESPDPRRLPLSVPPRPARRRAEPPIRAALETHTADPTGAHRRRAYVSNNTPTSESDRSPQGHRSRAKPVSVFKT